MCSAKRLSEQERKKEIMEAASKVISEKGLVNTTMEDIIAATTMSKGGVYHYYGSVVEIFKDIMIKGNDYRNDIIMEHLTYSQTGFDKQFIAKDDASIIYGSTDHAL